MFDLKADKNTGNVIALFVLHQMVRNVTNIMAVYIWFTGINIKMIMVLNVSTDVRGCNIVMNVSGEYESILV